MVIVLSVNAEIVNWGVLSVTDVIIPGGPIQSILDKTRVKSG